MANKIINQKEYLKKYTSLGDSDEKKKKKKKKHKTGIKTVKIIDDDIDLKNMRPIEEGEFDIVLDGEEAPQIAGIVDERGPVDFTDKRRWKIITEDEGGDLTVINRIIDKERNQDEMNVKQNNNDRELSPPKFKHKNKHIDLSPHRRFKDDNSDFKSSKASRSKDKHMNLSPRGSKDDDSDLSPPRQSKNDDSDLSPPRQSKNNDSDSDLSPSRQSKNYDSDLSPPRKSTKHRASSHNTSGRSYRISGNRNSDSDFSPPRKRKQNPDTDLYENRRNKKNKDPDLSTSRRKEHRSRRDHSPHSSSRRFDRGHDYHEKSSSRSSRYDVSRSNRDKREKEYEDRSHKSRSYSNIKEKRKKSRWNEETDNSERGHVESHPRDRATKTLDGKTAGFQAAGALREETEAHKRQEAEQFNKLSKELTGEGQATIVRDKMGKRRNLEVEAAEKYEQETKQREMNEKYAKWGKGLKQVEDHQEKLKNDLHEMHKPLARYADDADLDKQLREQEREGDPMLEYIKQKQIKEGKRKADPPQYQGSYAPNRFGIKPGHRWDGVDRSNGYEKKWFEAQNTKVAQQEEAYKWSTADM